MLLISVDIKDLTKKKLATDFVYVGVETHST